MASHGSVQALSPQGLKVVAILVALLAVPLGWLGFTSLVAGLSHSQAQLFLDDWGKSGQEPSERAWQLTTNAAERARVWYPGTNAAYADSLGRAYEWYKVKLPFGHPEAEAARRQAVEAYRESIASRPLWPYTWAQLAFAKLRLLEFDDEFDLALKKAAELGRERVRVHAPLAEIGMIAWPSLDTEQRAATWRSLELVLRYDPRRAKYLHQLAKEANLYPQLCAALDPELLQKRRWCR